jgi:thioredoxin-related protein
MRQHLALLASLCLLAVSTGPDAVSAKEAAKADDGKAAAKPSDKAPDKLEWLAFDAATQKANSQNKHMIVDVYTSWCGWCRIMEKQTYGDPEVSAYLKQNFVLVKVNGESSSKMHWQGKELTEREFARAVGVTGYPATYFLKPNADMLGGVSGFIRSPEFMIYAKYISTRWYEKGKIQTYVDSLRAAAE